MIKKLRAAGGLILLLLGLLALGGFLFLAYYLIEELSGLRNDNEGLFIVGTYSTIMLVLAITGFVSGASLLRFLNLGRVWLGILCATGAILLGSTGLFIMSGSMSGRDTLFARCLVLVSAAMALTACWYWRRAVQDQQK